MKQGDIIVLLPGRQHWPTYIYAVDPSVDPLSIHCKVCSDDVFIVAAVLERCKRTTTLLRYLVAGRVVGYVWANDMTYL